MPLQQDRRALHRIPELDRHLPKTMEYLENALSGLKCQVFSPWRGRFAPGLTTASPAPSLPADADDALPVEETTRCYASTHPGQMHACGPTATWPILLELARRVNGKGSLAITCCWCSSLRRRPPAVLGYLPDPCVPGLPRGGNFRPASLARSGKGRHRQPEERK